jgi:hypothetical protein
MLTSHFFKYNWIAGPYIYEFVHQMEPRGNHSITFMDGDSSWIQADANVCILYQSENYERGWLELNFNSDSDNLNDEKRIHTHNRVSYKIEKGNYFFQESYSKYNIQYFPIKISFQKSPFFTFPHDNYLIDSFPSPTIVTSFFDHPRPFLTFYGFPLDNSKLEKRIKDIEINCNKHLFDLSKSHFKKWNYNGDYWSSDPLLWSMYQLLHFVKYNEKYNENDC